MSNGVTTKEAVDQGDDTPLRRHYGRKSLRSSLRYFVLGKGFKIFGTVAAMLIMARWLSVGEYAAFVAMQAMIEVARIVTSVGASAVMLRFLPELRASGNNRSAYRLLSIGNAIRTTAIVLIMAAAFPFLPFIGEQFNLNDWLWLVPWFLVVGALDLITHGLSQSLESFLWQKEAQMSLAIGNLMQLVLLVLLVVTGSLTLPTAILAEGIGLVVALVLVYAGLYRRWRADDQRHEGEQGWLRANARRLIRFGAWTFALNLTRVLYGPGPNRLIVANRLPTADLAGFGFAGNIANLGRRMLPSRLMSTLIQPLLMAHFSVSGDFERLSGMLNLIYRINLALLLLPIGLLLLAGEPVIDWVTGDKYGAMAPLIAGLLVVLISESMRGNLELAVQAVEKNHIFVGSNLVQSASLFLAIPLLGIMGPWAVVLVNLLGTVSANIIIVVWLRRTGFRFRFMSAPILQVAAYGGIAMLGAWGVVLATSQPLTALIVMPALYLGCFAVRPPFSASEKELLTGIFKRRGKRGGKTRGGSIIEQEPSA